jgi:hypothetical protein
VSFPAPSSGGGTVKSVSTGVIPHTDFASYIPTGFPITSLNTGTGEVQILGDHRTVFPAGGKCGIDSNVGNPSGGIFGINTVSFNGTHTLVTVFESLVGYTATGNLNTFGQAGKAIYTPSAGEILLATVLLVPSAITAVSSNLGVSIGVYSTPQAFTNGSLATDGSAVDAAIGISDAKRTPYSNGYIIYSSAPAVLSTEPVTLTLDDSASGADPGVTAGSLEAIVVVLSPS